MYYFVSGYTAKVAGTEEGVNEPEATFSACFGAPFLPLHPHKYAELLGKKIKEASQGSHGKISVWLINTGWTGGAYGEGNRIELAFTRSMIKSALTGKLNKIKYIKQPLFKLDIPKNCPDIPNSILNPRDTWPNKRKYDESARKLANRFIENFKKYADRTSKGDSRCRTRTLENYSLYRSGKVVFI